MKHKNRNYLLKILVVLAAISSVAQLPLTISSMTGSVAIACLTAGVIIVVVFVVLFVNDVPPVFLRRAGVRTKSPSIVLPESKEFVEIDSEYNARVSTRRSLLFLDEPLAEELVDIIEVDPKESVDEQVYTSEDSVVSEIRRKANNVVAIFWRPKQPIIPFKLYHHISSYKSPSLYGPDAFWQASHIDKRTGTIVYSVKSSTRIEKAIAFKIPRSHKKISEFIIVKCALYKNLRDATQPRVSPCRKSVTWALENPEYGRTYVFFAIYEGWEGKIKARYEKTLINRIRLKLM